MSGSSSTPTVHTTRHYGPATRVLSEHLIDSPHIVPRNNKPDEARASPNAPGATII